MDNSKKIPFSKDLNNFDRNNAASRVNLTSGYFTNHGNTTDNLKTQISNLVDELEQKRFTLAILKNREKFYEELIKSLEEEMKCKKQIMSLQQQVFNNRIKFSDELLSFVLNDTTVTRSDELFEYITDETSKECQIVAGDESFQNALHIDDDMRVELNINPPKYAFRDEDDKIFEELQFPDETEHGDRKVKFIFKKPKLSKQ